jgi:hypothetical protein
MGTLHVQMRSIMPACNGTAQGCLRGNASRKKLGMQRSAASAVNMA